MKEVLLAVTKKDLTLIMAGLKKKKQSEESHFLLEWSDVDS